MSDNNSKKVNFSDKIKIHHNNDLLDDEIERIHLLGSNNATSSTVLNVIVFYFNKIMDINENLLQKKLLYAYIELDKKIIYMQHSHAHKD
jgi:hypothetical protein